MSIKTVADNIYVLFFFRFETNMADISYEASTGGRLSLFLVLKKESGFHNVVDYTF